MSSDQTKKPLRKRKRLFAPLWDFKRDEPAQIDEDSADIPVPPPVARAGLDNSVLFDIHRISDFAEVRDAVDAIYAEFKAEKIRGHEDITKRHIQLVLLNLYKCWLDDATRYVAYHRRSNDYLAKNSRYNKLHISRSTIPVADGLIKLGYADGVNGFFDRRIGGKSRTARLRATDKLIALIKDHRIQRYMIETARNRECIILRDWNPKTKRKYDVPYQDTNDTNRMRQKLYAYNNLLRRTHIDLQEGPGVEIPEFDRENKFVRRIFSNGRWDHGGRFYGGWWQNIESELRGRLRIDGDITVERDYSGIHIMLLYLKEG